MHSVGFDLDMTLVDSSEAIVQTSLKVLKNFSAEVDHEEIYESVGLPIKESFKKWVGVEYLEAYQQYVSEYQNSGYRLSTSLPGAKLLLDTLIVNGVRVIVITAKNPKSAEIQLSHLKIPFTLLVGDVFREGKTQAMTKTGCIEYVGDHIEDYLASCGAGIPFIGVNSNPAQNLRRLSAGNFPVINSLDEFFQFSIISTAI